jgi:hypothetical protein
VYSPAICAISHPSRENATCNKTLLTITFPQSLLYPLASIVLIGKVGKVPRRRKKAHHARLKSTFEVNCIYRALLSSSLTSTACISLINTTRLAPFRLFTRVEWSFLLQSTLTTRSIAKEKIETVKVI